MIVGCYTLDLYCRHQTSKFDETHKLEGYINFIAFPAQYTGPTEADCKKQARRRGWVFGKDRDATCRLCSNK